MSCKLWQVPAEAKDYYMKVLVIIPAYNESESILGVVNELKTKCPDYDYVVVNDCSKDNTLEILRENNINHLNLPVNLGIGGGMQTGFKYAVERGYDIGVQLDGDGQHDPAFIKDLIAEVEAGNCDICIGSRFISHEGFQTSGMRRLGIGILKMLIKISCGITITDATSGFRAINRKALIHYTRSYAQDYPEPEACVSAYKNGLDLKEIPVIMRERQGGKSSINIGRSVYYMAKVSIAILLYGFARRADK